MKILDLRPWPAKLAHSLWQVNGDTPGGETTRDQRSGWGLGALISRITRGRLKNRPPVPRKPFIVSVGNLALGGTGKTPVVATLCHDLADSGLSGAILTRGYGSSLEGPVVVRPDLENAGDEARLLAREMEACGWIVVQSKNRLAGLHWIQNQPRHCDIVIAEDAHQTPNLPRHLDIIILDKWHVFQERDMKIVSAVCGPVFPFGPYREDSEGAQRAGIWLLEADGNEKFASRDGVSIDVVSFQREAVVPSVQDPGISYGVLSGIARPWRFEASMERVMGHEAALAVRCSDHDSYDAHMVRKIVTAARDAQVGLVLTTAKDWVKLKGVWPSNLPLEVAGLNISWGKGKTLPDLVRERFHEA